MTKREASSKQEHMIAEHLGWTIVSGSGARPTRPGDVCSNDWLGECKTHVEPKESINIQIADWLKICAESLTKQPVLFVDDGTQAYDHTWVLVRHVSGFGTTKIANSKLLTCNRSSITFKHNILDSDRKSWATFYHTNIAYQVNHDKIGECYVMWLPHFVQMAGIGQ